MRNLRKWESYALLRAIDNALNTIKRSPHRSAHRDDENKKGIMQCLQPIAYCSKLVTLIISFSYMLFSDAQAQSAGERAAKGLGEEVSIGHRVPPEFWTKEHLFYINGDTVRKTLDEHKGKLIVLDFWFSGCVPCLLHQKEIKNFVREYPNDLVVIMVNSKKTKEGYDKIDDLYGKGYFEKFGIDHFETIIEDEYLTSIFPSTSYPHYVWINSLGRLQLKTFRNLLDRNYVAPFIDRP